MQNLFIASAGTASRARASSVTRSDCEITGVVDENLLLLRSVEDLQNVLGEGGLLGLIGLQKELNIAQFPEVEISLFLDGVHVHLHLLDLSKKLGGIACFPCLVGGCFVTSRLASGRGSRGLGLRATGSRCGGLNSTHLGRGLVGGSGARAYSTDCYFIAAKDVEEVLPLAAAHRIIGLAVVLDVEEALHPLEELKVILVLSLHKLVHINVTLDLVLREGLLQNFEVLDIFVVMLGAPLNFGHGYRSRIYGVDDLAVDGTGSALLDLGQL